MQHTRNSHMHIINTVRYGLLGMAVRTRGMLSRAWMRSSMDAFARPVRTVPIFLRMLSTAFSIFSICAGNQCVSLPPLAARDGCNNLCTC